MAAAERKPQTLSDSERRLNRNCLIT